MRSQQFGGHKQKRIYTKSAYEINQFEAFARIYILKCSLSYHAYISSNPAKIYYMVLNGKLSIIFL